MGLNTPMPDFVAGWPVTEPQLDALADGLDGIQAAWDNFVPTVGGWTLGNGTVLGRYLQIGKTVQFRARLLLGSTTVTGATLTLGGLPLSTPADWASALRWLARDVSASVSAFGDADMLGGSAGLNLRATTPFTWAAGDFIGVAGTYEAA